MSSRACIFFLPPSPSDTNPPLGPAILAGRAHEFGLHVDVRDLNIEFINRFRATVRPEHYSSIGDHGKDRRLVRMAASNLFSQFGVDSREEFFRPDIGEAEAGMHYTFQGIENAIKRHVRDGSELAEWLEGVLDETMAEGFPEVVGVSIMGPSQVFCSLLLLALVKRRMPNAITVIGGSHVTLLANLMTSESRYRENVDVVLPGHSEDELVDLLLDMSMAEIKKIPERSHSDHFSYLPLFRRQQLDLYAEESLTLPVQFTRGCSYARCTYCTYPVVEPISTRLHFEDAVAALETLRYRHGVDRFSLKDSLLTVPMLKGLADILRSRDSSRIMWSGTTKITRGLIKHAQALSESGLATLEFGVESIFDRQQRLIDKRAPLSVIEDVIYAMAENGIVAIVNLMFGFPGETLDEAEAQVEWARNLKARLGGRLVDFSLNMLEVVRGSPMAREGAAYGIVGVAPWAYRYQWGAPGWRQGFGEKLDALEERGDWVEGLSPSV